MQTRRKQYTSFTVMWQIFNYPANFAWCIVWGIVSREKCIISMGKMCLLYSMKNIGDIGWKSFE